MRGLDSFPDNEIPDVYLVHFPFQIMVALGFLFVGVGVWFWGVAWLQKRIDPGRLLLLALVAVSWLGFVAIEAGWFVTEFGRQPWIIYRVMETSAGATPRDGIWVLLLVFSGVYLALTAGLAGVLLLQRRIRTETPPST